MATRRNKKETGIIVVFGLGVLAGMAILGVHIKNTLRKSADKPAVDQTISEEQ